jgi:tRNA A37 threonylcarbamoyladenosine dehydratase
MSQQLINHSPDLKRLQDERYDIEIRGAYLLVHKIPYVCKVGQIAYGDLVSELTLSNNTATARPGNHVIYFMGEYPCYKDGNPIEAIRHASQTLQLSQGITVNHSFSNKPQAGYPDYYAKVSRYAEIISAPAKSIDPTVSEKASAPNTDEYEESVFNYLDTNSSRVNINMVNQKFKKQKIAIIGLGGTGAYILDLVAKTQVQEIHLFDADDLLQHNAFRSPGAASAEQLSKHLKKVDYYKEIYARMHKGIQAHECYIDAKNLPLLDFMSYAFISVDKNSVRKIIMDYLVFKKISFIDVGLGVNFVEGEDILIGTLRLTAGTPAKNDHLSKRIIANDGGDDNEYATNIQVADLNALNATLAVIKWKKMSGFYQDLEREHHSTYSINVSQLINEDLTA